MAFGTSILGRGKETTAVERVGHSHVDDASFLFIGFGETQTVARERFVDFTICFREIVGSKSTYASGLDCSVRGWERSSC